MGAITSCFHKLPTIGEINGKYFVEIKGINDNVFGRTRESVGVYEIEVKDKPKVLKVGKIIKDMMFSDYPDFLLNIIATSAYVNEKGISDYANPLSHWYNVFYGFYEINVPVDKVSSAYGFDVNGNVIPMDIIKIGLCDWNLVTAYMYGVPLEYCKDNVKITGYEQIRLINKSVKIGNFTYQEVEFGNIIGTSVYPAKESLVDNAFYISDMLQKSWGKHGYIEGYNQPFPPVRMSGRFYITWSVFHDDDLGVQCYKTIVGGGVINMDYPDVAFNLSFLDKQMEMVRESIIANEQI